MASAAGAEAGGGTATAAPSAAGRCDSAAASLASVGKLYRSSGATARPVADRQLRGQQRRHDGFHTQLGQAALDIHCIEGDAEDAAGCRPQLGQKIGRARRGRTGGRRNRRGFRRLFDPMAAALERVGGQRDPPGVARPRHRCVVQLAPRLEGARRGGERCRSGRRRLAPKRGQQPGAVRRDRRGAVGEYGPTLPQRRGHVAELQARVRLDVLGEPAPHRREDRG